MNVQTRPDTVFTPRQQEVLDVVLQRMVEEGDRFSIASVAREANCSKETLYKWYGDREGILAAAVRRQASAVQVGDYDRGRLDAGQLRARLEDFAATWLSVISSPTSLALNRVAISHAGSGKSRLGKLVLAQGRAAVAERVKPLLEDARQAGFLRVDSTEEAFRTFLGLVGRDVQVRLLLGEDVPADRAAIAREAARASRQFLTLFGADRADDHSGVAAPSPGEPRKR